MEKRKNRLCAWLLTAAMLLSMVPASVFAEAVEPTKAAEAQSQTAQQGTNAEVKCSCEALCTKDAVKKDCPLCGAEKADLTKVCKGAEAAKAAKAAEATKVTEVTKVTEATEAAEATKATEATEATEATKTTEATEVTEATEATEAAEAAEATKATDPSEATEAAETEPAAAEDAQEADKLTAFQAQIDALPTVEAFQAMEEEGQQATLLAVQAIADAYEALTEEEQRQLDISKLEALFAFVNGQVETLDDAFDADFSNIPAKATSFGKFSTMLNWSSGLPDTDKRYKAGDGTITWNAAEKKLVLENASVNIEMNGNGAIQLPSGQSVTVELIGNNVFTETGSQGGVYQSQGFFNTSGSLSFTGDGSLTMSGSSMGMRINAGASVVFNQGGTVSIAARNCGIQQQGNITVNSGRLTVSASLASSNVWGIYAYSGSSNTSFVMNGGYVEVHADNATGNNSGGIYASSNRGSTMAIHGGELHVTAAAEAVYMGYETITIDGSARVTAKSKTKQAMGNCLVSGSAVVNAETEQGGSAMSLLGIHDSASVTASGYTGGVSLSQSFVLTDSATVVARSTAPNWGTASNLYYLVRYTSNLVGCKISVDTDREGSNAIAWGWDYKTHPVDNDTYKYVKIERCTHSGAQDDGDCTTAVICPDCNGTVILAAKDHHTYATEWTHEENGVHSLYCTNELFPSGHCEDSITVSAPDVVVDYDGNPHGITVTAPEGATVRYKNGDSYSSENPGYTEVGSYIVEYLVEGLGTTLKASAKVTIQPRKIVPEATLTPTSYIYDGEAKEPTVTLKVGDTIIPASNYTVEYQNNTEVGVATVVIRAVEGINETFDDITVPFDIVYQVTLNPNGGSLDSTIVLTDTDSKVKSLPTPTREGHVFGGWFWDEGGNNAFNCGTDTITAVGTTLYACWYVNVTFDPNGGSGETVTIQTDKDDHLRTLPKEPTRNQYRFDGWYTEKSGGTKVTVDSDAKFTEATTLYAHWAYVPVTVTFNPNGGSVTPKTMQTVEGGKLEKKLPTPTRSGYRFQGWYNAQNQKVDNDTTYTSNTTLTAKWKRTISATGNPSTGDQAPIELAAAIFLLATAGLITTVVVKKRKK